MTSTNESLPAACEQALERQTRLLAGEPLSVDEQSELASHLASCGACRGLQAELAQTDEAVRAAYSGAQASPDFAARAMAALPAAKPAAPAELRVLAAAPRRRWSWRRAGVAVAGLAASALLFFAIAHVDLFTHGGQRRPIAIKKNGLRGANGQPVSEVKAGEVYTAQDTTVLALANAGLLKLQPGTTFELQASDTGSNPNVQLKSGDLYVWGENDQKPLRVSGVSFEAELHKGDFFVADEGVDNPASVVIVFAGRAQVSFERETMPLHAGQVFVTMGRDEWAVSQTLELTDAIEEVQDTIPIRQQDVASLRKDYEARVHSYQRELKLLERLVREEKDAQRLAELRERYQRVSTYRDAHQRRLDSLWQASPFEAIRRGLDGHENPTRWL